MNAVDWNIFVGSVAVVSFLALAVIGVRAALDDTRHRRGKQ